MKSVSESRREGDGLARDELDERTRQEYSLGGCSPDNCADPECDERMFGATAMKSPTGGAWAYWSDDGQLLTIVRPKGDRAHVSLDDDEFAAWQTSGFGGLVGVAPIPFPEDQPAPTAHLDVCPRCERSISGALKRETALDIMGVICGAIVALGFGLAVLGGVVIGVIWAIQQVLA